jgi:ankyrin repeat protein
MRSCRGLGLGGLAVAVTLMTGALSPADSLIDAARQGDVAAVQALIKKHADVNAAEGDGLTALHVAAQEGNLQIVQLLLKSKANVAAKTRLGDYTPLHLAAEGAHADVVAALLQAGADVHAVTTYTGVTPLHLAAKAVGGEATVKLLLDKGSDPNAREAAAGQTALMFAAADGRLAAVKELLAHGADPKLATKTVDVLQQLAVDREAQKRLQQARQDIRRNTPGGTARALTVDEDQKAIEVQREFLNNQEEVAKVVASFDPKSLQGSGTFYKGGPKYTTLPTEMLVGKTGGMTALHHAARAGHLDVVDALLDGHADINQRSGDGSTPLVLSLLNGQFDVAMRLIERKADVNIRTSTDGIGPLFATLQTRWALRFTYQPQPLAQDIAKADYMDVLKALLVAGADPNVAITEHIWHFEWEGKIGLDITGATPFWRAAFAQDLPAMKLLKSYGADPNAPTKFGPIGLRTRRQPDGRQQEDSGLPLIPEGTPNMWPIHAAAGGGYLGLGAFQQNNVPNGFLDAVKWLVEEQGADVNLPDAWGYTPLHYAAVHGANDVIEYLVSKGANVRALSRLGQSPVDMARGGQGGFFLRTPYPKTVELLQGMGSPLVCLATHFRDTGDYCPQSGVPMFEDENHGAGGAFGRQQPTDDTDTPAAAPASAAKPATPQPQKK